MPYLFAALVKILHKKRWMWQIGNIIWSKGTKHVTQFKGHFGKSRTWIIIEAIYITLDRHFYLSAKMYRLQHWNANDGVIVNCFELFAVFRFVTLLTGSNELTYHTEPYTIGSLHTFTDKFFVNTVLTMYDNSVMEIIFGQTRS